MTCGYAAGVVATLKSLIDNVLFALEEIIS
jgi:H+/Cl- antiporter ClcA